MVARASGGTARQRSTTASGAPLVAIIRAPSGNRTRVLVIRRSWSNGNSPWRRKQTAWSLRASGASHRARSSGLPAASAEPAAAGSTSVASSPSSSGASAAAPSGPIEAARVTRPSVSVPVLSVTSTSMSPRSSMQTRRLTRTLRRASRRVPTARLVLTTAGRSWGVMPTAMASEKSSDSINGLCSSTFVTRISPASASAT